MTNSRVLGASAAAVAAVLLAGCAAPSACVGGYGVCKSPELVQRYVVVDPSGSQSTQIDKQVNAIDQIAAATPVELIVVRMGERPSTSSVVARAKFPKIDANNPNAVQDEAALLKKLEQLVRSALAKSTSSSDQFGALALVRDDILQRGVTSPVDVTVLGDGEPCVTGICWTHAVPKPADAVQQVAAGYGSLDFSGEKVTFVVGGDASAATKAPSYVAALAAADTAVCRWAKASSCSTTTTIAEANS